MNELDLLLTILEKANVKKQKEKSFDYKNGWLDCVSFILDKIIKTQDSIANKNHK